MIIQPASLIAARCTIGGSRGQSAGGSARAEDSGAYSVRPRRKSPHRAHATSPRTAPHAAPRRRDCPPPSGPRAFADTGVHECVDVVLLSEEHLLALRRAGAHVPPAHAQMRCARDDRAALKHCCPPTSARTDCGRGPARGCELRSGPHEHGAALLSHHTRLGACACAWTSAQPAARGQPWLQTTASMQRRN